MLRPPALPPIARYAVALVSVLLAWAGKVGTDPFLRADQPLFLWFIGAVLFAAWYGGLGPGIFATVLSALVADVILFRPHYEPFVRNAGQYFQIAVFGDHRRVHEPFLRPRALEPGAILRRAG